MSAAGAWSTIRCLLVQWSSPARGFWSTMNMHLFNRSLSSFLFSSISLSFQCKFLKAIIIILVTAHLGISWILSYNSLSGMVSWVDVWKKNFVNFYSSKKLFEVSGKNSAWRNISRFFKIIKLRTAWDPRFLVLSFFF